MFIIKIIYYLYKYTMTIQYGKECNTNKDCSSNICEMTYIDNNKRLPNTRKCVIKSKRNKRKGKKDESSEVTSDKSLFTLKECRFDSECKSGLCDTKYSVDKKTKHRINDGKHCLNQEKKFGKYCSYNADCDSNRCVTTNNSADKLEKKCLLYKNPPVIPDRNFGEINDSVLPDNDPQKSPAWKDAKNKPILLSENRKKTELEGTGPIADIIVLLMEIVAVGIQFVIKMLLYVWLLVFKVVSFLPSLLLKIKFFNFSDKHKNNKGECVDSVTITSSSRTKFVTLLFPPYGIFLHLGGAGLKHILICCVLTLLFYFPGLMYAFSIIEKIPKPKVPDSKSFLDNNDLYNMFMYGQLIKDDICLPKKTLNNIITIIFPPLGLYLKQVKNKNTNMKKIIICFILTGLFYFPGLLYAFI
jgi:uncharacterized membrane protein YqaE (UPF0057 family)